MLLLHNLQAEIPMRMNSSRRDQGRTTAAAEGAVEALAVAPPYRTWGNEETFTKETIKDIFQDILKKPTTVTLPFFRYRSAPAVGVCILFFIRYS